MYCYSIDALKQKIGRWKVEELIDEAYKTGKHDGFYKRIGKEDSHSGEGRYKNGNRK